MRKPTRMLTTVVFLLFGTISAFAQTREVPHYFPSGVIQTTDPVKQWKEYMEILAATGKAYEANSNFAAPLMPNGVRVEHEIDGKKFVLILDRHARLDDGRIRFTSYVGQELITEAQLKTVINYTLQEIEAAVDLNHAFYQDLRKMAMESLAGESGLNTSVEELEKVVKQKVPENPKFTFEELYWLPKKMEKKDFVPNEIHLGYGPYIPGAIGFAWLDSGLVYLTPIGQVADYLMGKPAVTQHELIHANKNLQSMPFAEAFDVEFAASIPEMLAPEDHVRLQFHGYVSDLREMAWVFFGLDYKRIRKEIVQFDAAGNLMIDEVKFAHYAKLYDQVKAEYMKFFPKAIGEFYGKIMFWSAMHDKLVDKRAIWRIMMRKYYEPTILGGREETAKWLRANEQNVKDDSQKAWDASGGALDNSDDEHMQELTRFARVLGIDPNDKAQVDKLLREFKIKPEDLRQMDGDQVMKLVREILDKKLYSKGGAR
ncbi:MAG: hypothetical protein WD898_01765 [Candidatus Paceibacterota bacterium]